MEERLNAFKRNVNAERGVISAYGAFSFSSADWESQFEKWLARYPSAYQPYMARANYYHSLAWKARGGKFIQETPAENITQMRAFITLAQTDVDQALRLQPQSLAAYHLQIYISRLQGDKEDARKAIRQGTEYYPYTYYQHLAYMDHLQPRWGGSFQQTARHAIIQGADSGY